MSSPVTEQPGPNDSQFKTIPKGLLSSPPGLENLAQIDQLLYKRHVTCTQMMTSCQVKNIFTVTDREGQQMFHATEESEKWPRLCCGAARGFIMHVKNNNGEEVIRTERTFGSCTGCYCCADGGIGWEMQVEAPVGQVVGYVCQHKSVCKADIKTYDADRRPLLDAWGPCCTCMAVCCTGDIDFSFTDKTGRSAGVNIVKQWSGVSCDAVDHYTLSVPVSMDIRQKALMLAAVFMVDMLVFQAVKNTTV